MKGRRIRGGHASGTAVSCACPVSFLGGVEPKTGKILEGDCESRGRTVANKVFSFPFGKGSTVGSYALYGMKLNGTAPVALVNESAEPIVATAAIISEVPMVDGIDVSVIRTGDEVVVDADHGSLELKGVSEKHVVTGIVRRKGKILLLRRSGQVGSYRGRWASVSGFIEGDEEDAEAMTREMEEEIGLRDVRLVKHIGTQMFRDGEVVWCVHPFLFESKEAAIRIDWEHECYEWVRPKDLANYPTVPGLQKVISKLTC